MATSTLLKRKHRISPTPDGQSSRALEWTRRILTGLATAFVGVPILSFLLSVFVPEIQNPVLALLALLALWMTMKPLDLRALKYPPLTALVCLGLVLAWMGSRPADLMMKDVRAAVKAGDASAYPGLLARAASIGPDVERRAMAAIAPEAHLQWLREQFGDTRRYLKELKADLPNMLAEEELRVLPLIEQAQADAAEENRLRKERAAVERQRREAREKALAAAAEAEHRKNGFHCLSAWDGSHAALARAIKENLREPGSFQHVETVIAPVDANGRHTLIMTYRGRNGFGGMNVEQIVAEVSNASCHVLEVRRA